MNILFSLVIPVYNVELYIEKCLRSCLSQECISPSEYELVIVDDGSPDNSISIARKIVEEYPLNKVTFVVRKNGGLSSARNTGTNYTKGKYIWFIDSDDWIAPNSLSCLKSKLENTQQIDILTFSHQTVFFDGTISQLRTGKDYVGTGFDHLSQHSFLSVCLCLYLFDFLKDNNLSFKEGILWEDSEFNLRAYGLAKKHYYCSDALYYYVRRINSITTKGVSFKMIESWIMKIDSISSFYKDRKLDRKQKRIININLASTLMAAVAGFNELSDIDRNYFRNILLQRKRFYLHFFLYSGKISFIICGLMIILALPVAENILAYMVKKAITRGESNS